MMKSYRHQVKSHRAKVTPVKEKIQKILPMINLSRAPSRPEDSRTTGKRLADVIQRPWIPCQECLKEEKTNPWWLHLPWTSPGKRHHSKIPWCGNHKGLTLEQALSSHSCRGRQDQCFHAPQPQSQPDHDSDKLLQRHGSAYQDKLQWHGSAHPDQLQWHGSAHPDKLQWHGSAYSDKLQWHGSAHSDKLQWHGSVHSDKLQWHGSAHSDKLQWHGSVHSDKLQWQLVS